MSPVAALHFPFAPRGSMVSERQKSSIHLSATPEECDDAPPESRAISLVDHRQRLGAAGEGGGLAGWGGVKLSRTASSPSLSKVTINPDW